MNPLRHSMTWRRGVVLTAVGAMLGCSAATRDRWMHFFFEIPPDGTVEERPVDHVAFAGADPAVERQDAVHLVRHGAVVQHACSKCHDPEQRLRVNEELLMTSCQECHTRYFGDAVQHGPVAERECLSCHTMHRSVHPGLLVHPVLDLCVDCHDEPEDLSEEAHAVQGVSRCTACHDPHFGEGFFLKPSRPQLPPLE